MHLNIAIQSETIPPNEVEGRHMIRKFYLEYNSQSESTLLDCQRMRLALIVAKYSNI